MEKNSYIEQRSRSLVVRGWLVARVSRRRNEKEVVIEILLLPTIERRREEQRSERDKWL